MTHYRNLAQGRGGEVDVGKAAHQRARLAKAQAGFVEVKGKKLHGEIVDTAEGRGGMERCAAHGARWRARGAEPMRATASAFDAARRRRD
jgi:hypothetical protein